MNYNSTSTNTPSTTATSSRNQSDRRASRSTPLQIYTTIHAALEASAPYEQLSVALKQQFTLQSYRDQILRFAVARNRSFKELPAFVRIPETKAAKSKEGVSGSVSPRIEGGPSSASNAYGRSQGGISSSGTSAADRALLFDERKYYERMVVVALDRLQLYPYIHIVKLVDYTKVTPLNYYLTMLSSLLLAEKGYDSLPNFTAVDILNMLGIGRNQYLEITKVVRSKATKWKSFFEKIGAGGRTAADIRKLLPQQTMLDSVVLDPFWEVRPVAGISNDEVKKACAGSVEELQLYKFLCASAVVPKATGQPVSADTLIEMAANNEVPGITVNTKDVGGGGAFGRPFFAPKSPHLPQLSDSSSRGVAYGASNNSGGNGRTSPKRIHGSMSEATTEAASSVATRSLSDHPSSAFVLHTATTNTNSTNGPSNLHPQFPSVMTHQVPPRSPSSPTTGAPQPAGNNKSFTDATNALKEMSPGSSFGSATVMTASTATHATPSTTNNGVMGQSLVDSTPTVALKSESALAPTSGSCSKLSTRTRRPPLLEGAPLPLPTFELAMSDFLHPGGSGGAPSDSAFSSKVQSSKTSPSSLTSGKQRLLTATTDDFSGGANNNNSEFHYMQHQHQVDKLSHQLVATSWRRERRGWYACELPFELVNSLHRKGLVYANFSVRSSERIVVPPLERFVMNRTTSDDPQEALLYHILSTMDQNTPLSMLSELLRVPKDEVCASAAVYVRLGLAKRVEERVPSAFVAPYLQALTVAAALNSTADGGQGNATNVVSLPPLHSSKAEDALDSSNNVHGNNHSLALPTDYLAVPSPGMAFNKGSGPIDDTLDSALAVGAVSQSTFGGSGNDALNSQAVSSNSFCNQATDTGGFEVITKSTPPMLPQQSMSLSSPSANTMVTSSNPISSLTNTTSNNLSTNATNSAFVVGNNIGATSNGNAPPQAKILAPLEHASWRHLTNNVIHTAVAKALMVYLQKQLEGDEGEEEEADTDGTASMIDIQSALQTLTVPRIGEGDQRSRSAQSSAHTSATVSPSSSPRRAGPTHVPPTTGLIRNEDSNPLALTLTTNDLVSLMGTMRAGPAEGVTIVHMPSPDEGSPPPSSGSGGPPKSDHMPQAAGPVVVPNLSLNPTMMSALGALLTSRSFAGTQRDTSRLGDSFSGAQNGASTDISASSAVQPSISNYNTLLSISNVGPSVSDLLAMSGTMCNASLSVRRRKKGGLGATSSHHHTNTKRIALFFDAKIAGLLMMTNLSSDPTFKQHAVTLFEAGKLPYEQLRGFVEKLQTIQMSEKMLMMGEEAAGYFTSVFALRDILTALLNQVKVPSCCAGEIEVGSSDGKAGKTLYTEACGVDMLKIEAMNDLTAETRYSVMCRNYGAFFFLSPTPSVAPLIDLAIENVYGSTVGLQASPWLLMYLYSRMQRQRRGSKGKAVGAPPTVILPMGMRVPRWPLALGFVEGTYRPKLARHMLKVHDVVNYPTRDDGGLFGTSLLAPGKADHAVAARNSESDEEADDNDYPSGHKKGMTVKDFLLGSSEKRCEKRRALQEQNETGDVTSARLVSVLSFYKEAERRGSWPDAVSPSSRSTSSQPTELQRPTSFIATSLFGSFKCPYVSFMTTPQIIRTKPLSLDAGGAAGSDGGSSFLDPAVSLLLCNEMLMNNPIAFSTVVGAPTVGHARLDTYIRKYVKAALDYYLPAAAAASGNHHLHHHKKEPKGGAVHKQTPWKSDTNTTADSKEDYHYFDQNARKERWSVLSEGNSGPAATVGSTINALIEGAKNRKDKTVTTAAVLAAQAAYLTEDTRKDEVHTLASSHRPSPASPESANGRLPSTTTSSAPSPPFQPISPADTEGRATGVYKDEEATVEASDKLVEIEKGSWDAIPNQPTAKEEEEASPTRLYGSSGVLTFADTVIIRDDEEGEDEDCQQSQTAKGAPNQEPLSVPAPPPEYIPVDPEELHIAASYDPSILWSSKPYAIPLATVNGQGKTNSETIEAYVRLPGPIWTTAAEFTIPFTAVSGSDVLPNADDGHHAEPTPWNSPDDLTLLILSHIAELREKMVARVLAADGGHGGEGAQQAEMEALAARAAALMEAATGGATDGRRKRSIPNAFGSSAARSRRLKACYDHFSEVLITRPDEIDRYHPPTPPPMPTQDPLTTAATANNSLGLGPSHAASKPCSSTTPANKFRNTMTPSESVEPVPTSSAGTNGRSPKILPRKWPSPATVIANASAAAAKASIASIITHRDLKASMTGPPQQQQQHALDSNSKLILDSSQKRSMDTLVSDTRYSSATPTMSYNGNRTQAVTATGSGITHRYSHTYSHPHPMADGQALLPDETPVLVSSMVDFAATSRGSGHHSRHNQPPPLTLGGSFKAAKGSRSLNATTTSSTAAHFNQTVSEQLHQHARTRSLVMGAQMFSNLGRTADEGVERFAVALSLPNTPSTGTGTTTDPNLFEYYNNNSMPLAHQKVTSSLDGKSAVATLPNSPQQSTLYSPTAASLRGTVEVVGSMVLRSPISGHLSPNATGTGSTRVRRQRSPANLHAPEAGPLMSDASATVIYDGSSAPNTYLDSPTGNRMSVLSNGGGLQGEGGAGALGVPTPLRNSLKTAIQYQLYQQRQQQQLLLQQMAEFEQAADNTTGGSAHGPATPPPQVHHYPRYSTISSSAPYSPFRAYGPAVSPFANEGAALSGQQGADYGQFRLTMNNANNTIASYRTTMVMGEDGSVRGSDAPMAANYYGSARTGSEPASMSNLGPQPSGALGRISTADSAPTFSALNTPLLADGAGGAQQRRPNRLSMFAASSVLGYSIRGAASTSPMFYGAAARQGSGHGVGYGSPFASYLAPMPRHDRFDSLIGGGNSQPTSAPVASVGSMTANAQQKLKQGSSRSADEAVPHIDFALDGAAAEGGHNPSTVSGYENEISTDDTAAAKHAQFLKDFVRAERALWEITMAGSGFRSFGGLEHEEALQEATEAPTAPTIALGLHSYEKIRRLLASAIAAGDLSRTLGTLTLRCAFAVSAVLPVATSASHGSWVGSRGPIFVVDLVSPSITDISFGIPLNCASACAYLLEQMKAVPRLALPSFPAETPVARGSEAASSVLLKDINWGELASTRDSLRRQQRQDMSLVEDPVLQIPNYDRPSPTSPILSCASPSSPTGAPTAATPAPLPPTKGLAYQPSSLLRPSSMEHHSKAALALAKGLRTFVADILAVDAHEDEAHTRDSKRPLPEGIFVGLPEVSIPSQPKPVAGPLAAHRLKMKQYAELAGTSTSGLPTEGRISAHHHRRNAANSPPRLGTAQSRDLEQRNAALGSTAATNGRGAAPPSHLRPLGDPLSGIAFPSNAVGFLP